MATYYFSTSLGDDSRSSAQAQSQSTPWKTITKFNSFFTSLNAGDFALFNRGESYPGSMVISKSGSSGNLITIGAWGTGNKPVITGFSVITSGMWTSIGGGKYTVAVPNSPASVAEVTLDAAHVDMSKFPRGNTGYMRVTTGDTSTSITNGFVTNTGSSAQMPTLLSSAPLCVGGEIVWRPRHWVLWRGTINSQTSTQVNFTGFPSTSGGTIYGAQSDGGKAGYGFFLQNHPNLCTQLGDWAYTPGTHTLTMFFGGGGPIGHTVQVSTTTDLITVASRSFVKFDNLDLQGANNAIINMTTSPDITVNACNLFGSGIYGVFGNGASSRLTFTNNTMDRVHSNGLRSASSATAWTITDNTFTNIAATAGMGGSGEGQYWVILDAKNGSQVLRNNITNTGYVGISIQGSNNLVQYNYIDTYCTVKDDGGAIYLGGTSFTGSIIDHNICLNGIGVTQGTPDTSDPRAHGIYVDDGGNNAEIRFNTMAFNGNGGFSVHAGHELNIHDNTAFDNFQTGIKYYNDTNLLANISFNGNIMFAKTSSETLLVGSGGSSSTASWFTSANNNFWCRPLAETTVFSTAQGSFNLAGWKTFTGKEGASKSTPVAVSDVSKIRFEYNNTQSPKVVSLGATYVDVNNTSYPGTITLQPFTSAVLLQTSGSTSTTTTVAPTTTTTTTSAGTTSTTTTTTVALTALSFPFTSGAFAQSPIDQWGSGAGFGLTDRFLAGDGWIQADFTTPPVTTTAILGLDPSLSLDDFTLFDYAVYVASGSLVYTTIVNGTFTASAVTAVSGDKYRLNRTGTTVTASYSRDNGQSWILLRTFAVTSAANLYAKASIPTTSSFLLNPKGRNTSADPTTTTTTHAPTTTTTTAAPTTTTTTTAAPTTTTTTAAPTTTTTTTAGSTTTTTSGSTTTTTTLALTIVTFPQVSGTFSQVVSGKWGPGYGFGIANQFLAADGFFQADFNALEDTTSLLGLDEENALEDFPPFDYSVYVADGSNIYTTIENDVFTNTGVTAVIGDKFRLSRTGSTVKAEYSRDSGQTWTTLRTFSATTSASLYLKTSVPTTARFLLNPKGYQLSTVTTTTTTTGSTTTTTTHASTTSTTTIKKLTISTTKKNASCRGGSDGSIKITASGGLPPYQYKLNAGTYGSSSTFAGLRAGVYTVTAKDTANALATATVTIYDGFFKCR